MPIQQTFDFCTIETKSKKNAYPKHKDIERSWRTGDTMPVSPCFCWAGALFNPYFPPSLNTIRRLSASGQPNIYGNHLLSHMLPSKFIANQAQALFAYPTSIGIAHPTKFA